MGRAAAFSFYPGKNLGACGEGGAVTTNDAGRGTIRSECCVITGKAKSTITNIEGYNGRLDAIQAGILACEAAASCRLEQTTPRAGG